MDENVEGFGDMDDNDIGEEMDEEIGDFWFIIDTCTFVKVIFLLKFEIIKF